MAFTNTIWVEERTKKSSDGDDTTEDVWIDILFKYLVTPRVLGLAFRRKAHTRNSAHDSKIGIRDSKRIVIHQCDDVCKPTTHGIPRVVDVIIQRITTMVWCLKYYSLRKMYVIDMWYATTSLLHDRPSFFVFWETLLVNCYGLLYLLSRSFPPPSLGPINRRVFSFTRVLITILYNSITMKLSTTAILLSVGGAAAWSQPSRSSLRNLGTKTVVTKGPSRVNGNTMKMEGA